MNTVVLEQPHFLSSLISNLVQSHSIPLGCLTTPPVWCWWCSPQMLVTHPGHKMLEDVLLSCQLPEPFLPPLEHDEAPLSYKEHVILPQPGKIIAPLKDLYIYIFKYSTGFLFMFFLSGGEYRGSSVCAVTACLLSVFF